MSRPSVAPHAHQRTIDFVLDAMAECLAPRGASDDSSGETP
jgi:hypothetical protein